ncbi:pre-toxin TG domain-containing protein [Parageobacillus thermoglucosidasius]|uniref:pre-toxin TG domain-containing protein n=1 Tax=Parageobacillus thermoglucosidasius TaxID=1426 RepID=UPI0021AB7CEF|nr:pre-toxin TG domain-containing protein [Parageobacillus thermoglucosidasius]MED4905411.1 pre-toxin TG domain-containing protein [Parageobacillus thermoglucosidasius]MED4913810.1 pre-toxin TG domain-containing protein [Parageobacillus thermoglucosidasius]MED4943789.1 pre-toxin TG domain-containing protein [Parageobacillus thermoglucosidasius]MED4983693.1 pre-toxin TG domain-containing protein [Parageobacillus thermoglucosidasius]
MTTIRVKPEELETVAKHVPDAEDACRRARTSLSWELPSLVMEIPGISTDAIDSLRDELIHWLDRYEEKLNEAEELLYRTAAAIRQADQTLADNMKEFGLELSGWYDVQRLFGEYDPITGERISGWDRLVAGGMLLASFVPPVKGAGVAGKAAVKGAKAAGIVAEVLKWISKTKNVLNVDKIKGAFQTIYHQVIKGPITATIRSFKQQWEQLLENVGSVLMGPQPTLAGVGGPAPRMWMSGVEREAKGTMMNIVGNTGNSAVGKGTGGVAKGTGKGANNKIVYPSKPHTNKTLGHWEAMVDKAEELAKRDDVVKVYLNKGLSNEIPGITPNRRPDIMVVRSDGKIDQYEVPSKTDNIDDLISRMRDNQRLLGDRAGDIFILPPKK